ncbi:MAG: hypothetical protein WAL10_08230 [Acetobacteraceae bacterium]
MLSLLWPKTAQHEVHFVGLFAPLDVLEARERQRGDRLIGLARWQYHRVHSGIAYDLDSTLPLLHHRHAPTRSRQLSRSEVGLMGNMSKE